MRFLHTMVRVHDLDASLKFYIDIFGLREIRRIENEQGKFTLVFLAAPGDMLTGPDSRQSPLLELTYNWDTEDYTGGRNFGHLAYEVDNIYDVCAGLMEQGIKINRPPRDGNMAFIKSPDGISIELLQKGPALSKAEPWLSMPNSGHMVNRLFCGIDFGTSNTAMSAGSSGGDVGLVPLEDGMVTIPTVVFFNSEDNNVVFGRDAMAQYLTGYEGRLLRSLKSILGSELVKESTQVGMKKIDFRQIIGLFIRHIKSQAENYKDSEMESVVLGRPVRFVDDNDAADQRAQDDLEGIARAQGFKHIHFEYEPIAASRDYESSITSEELVLVFDIGGGTSDFSVVRLSPEARGAADRQKDILANEGIHIGGTNFDQKLSLGTVMQDLGYGSTLKSGLVMPNTPYFEMSTWHLINMVYTQKNISGMKSMRTQVERRDLLERYIKIQETQRGHEIAEKIEAAKIALSDKEAIVTDFSDIEADWHRDIKLKDLHKAIDSDIDRIVSTAVKAVTQGAGLSITDIDAIFMTGGSTGLPGFEARIRAQFPQAKIHHGDRFSSVAKGLGFIAAEIFA